jgi:hypothetical protein
MLKVAQRFGKRRSYHLYGELHSSPFFHSTNQHCKIQLATCSLPYLRLPKTPKHYMFTLKMVTAILAETLDNFQHSTRLSCKNYITHLVILV